MPQLTEFEPQWIDFGDRKGLGLRMRAPNNREYEIWCLFENPLDGGAAWPDNSRSLILAMLPDEGARISTVGCGTFRWKRTGDTFENLSLSPSLNYHQLGHFTIQNGCW